MKYASSYDRVHGFIEGWLSGGSCSSLALVRVPKVSTDPTCQPTRRNGWRRIEGERADDDDRPSDVLNPPGTP